MCVCVHTYACMYTHAHQEIGDFALQNLCKTCLSDPRQKWKMHGFVCAHIHACMQCIPETATAQLLNEAHARRGRCLDFSSWAMHLGYICAAYISHTHAWMHAHFDECIYIYIYVCILYHIGQAAHTHTHLIYLKLKATKAKVHTPACTATEINSATEINIAEKQLDACRFWKKSWEISRSNWLGCVQQSWYACMCGCM